jgi:hypothetical protein
MQAHSALFFSYLLGIYPPFLRYIHRLLTEQLAIFLVCAFLFHFCKLYKDGQYSRKQLVIASFCLGYLALTKVIFGYVILSGLVLCLFLYLWKKKDALKKALLVCVVSVLFCMPYLFYTYSLTGKVFYWSTSGGLALYLMSTSYDGGLGDWNVFKKHKADIFRGYENYSIIETDEDFKKRAVRNIVKNPEIYIKNWLANTGRLLFNYPFSYDTQKTSTYFYMFPGMVIVIFSVLCIYPAYAGRRIIPIEIYAVLIFGLIAFFGSSLIFVMNRQFWPLVPVFMLWMSFIFGRIVKIRLEK